MDANKPSAGMAVNPPCVPESYFLFRSVDVAQVQGGYIVVARMPVRYYDLATQVRGERRQWASHRLVFSTTAEMVSWIDGYFGSTPQELDRMADESVFHDIADLHKARMIDP